MQEHKPLIIQPADPEQDPEKTLPAIIEDDPVPAPKAYYVPNRHERRKHAAQARKERREKQKAKP